MSYCVLIADDEPLIIEGLKASIDWEAEGFSVDFSACSGAEAEMILQDEAPDLVLMDIRMPGLNGLDVIRRNKEQCPLTHFIIISGYAEFEYAREGISLNVEGYLLKPFSEEELLSMIRKVKNKLDADNADRSEQLLRADIEEDTGHLATLYPDGCYIYLQVGGKIDDLSGSEIRLKVSPQHYMIVSRAPLPLSEDTLPSAIRSISRMEYHGESLPDCIMQAYSMAHGFAASTGVRLFYSAPREAGSQVADHVDEQSDAPMLSAYIQEHFGEDISFIDLCMHFAMSATSVRNQLRKEVGMNFSQYLIQIRMVHASHLLRGDWYINDIAAVCGFEDPLYFRKVFKRYYGQTPSKYRAWVKQV